MFFDTQGVNYQHVIPPKTKINAVYYAQVLKSLQKHINKNRLHIASMWILHQDNAKPYIASIVRDFLEKPEIPTVAHRHYSPDLTACDFWLFPYLEKALRAANSAQIRSGDSEPDILQFTYAGQFRENHHDELDRKNEYVY